MNSRLRVLYAEDNVHDADLTRAYFSEHATEFEIEIAETGQACLDRLAGTKCDLLLLDYRLPDMEGLDILRALVHAGMPVPVVMVTGSGDEDLVVKALHLGAANYVPKLGNYLETLPDVLRMVVDEHRLKVNQGLLDAGPRRILYVEHHAMDIDLTLRHFADAAPRVELDVIRTCGDALTRLERSPAYDAVLIDLRMPDQSGLDFVREAKRRGLPLPPFIMLSGKGDEGAAIASLTLGAADYVAKREGYLDQLPYTIDHAIIHDRLNRINEQLQAELAERIRVQARILEQRATLNAILESADGPIFSLDREYRYTAFNSAHAAVMKALYGTGIQLGRCLAECQALPEDWQAAKKSIDRALHGETVLESASSGDEGRPRRHFEVAHNPVRTDAGEIIGVSVFARDITARKQAEDELRFRNLILSTQQEASIDGILVVDTNGRIISFNRRFAEMWGVHLDMMESKSDELALQLVMDKLASPEEFISRVRHLYATPDAESEDEVVLKDGRTFDRYSAAMRAADGTHFGRVWHFRDITARKQVEDSLRRSERKYRSLYESLMDGFATVDMAGRIGEVNAAFENMLGYSEEELRRLAYPDITPARWHASEAEIVAEQVMKRGFSDVYEKEYRRKDGTVVPVELRTFLVRDEAGAPRSMSALVRDITERKRAEKERERLEEQLQVSQKMEAIGSLAGGIAHDFNNLLSVVLSYAEFAIEQLPEGSSVRDDVLEIQKAGEHAARLTRQLLAFSRRQILQPESLRLNDIIAEVEQMLRRILGEDIDLVLSLAPDLGATLADPGQIEQVIMNLVVNARDAMPGGGKLTIETSNVEIDEEYAARHVDVRPGSYVRLVITDTGCGMDERTKARIFEPFFTTKEKGKGTGLGLSTAYGIVKQSGGSIWVYSEPDRGTTFKIYLPCEPSATGTRAVRPATLQTSARGTETVLVVEDEEALRRVTVRALQAAGYTVLTAANGGEALLTSARHAGGLHLLLTDVVMPGMGGRTLAEELARKRPGLKTLYMSGYTGDAIVHHGVLEAGTQFLAKPFTSVDLTRKVREVLDVDVDHADV